MDCRLAGNWLRATALASLLMLSACGSQDSSFSIDLHGSPNDVLGAIDEPALNQVTSYIPEAQINRSRPSDSEVLYTMPGEKPGAEITIKFTLTPLASGEGTKLDADFTGKTFVRIDHTIAMGALFTAHHLGAKAIVAMTDSGSTALWMSRHLIQVPIYALTGKVATQRRMTLYRNVRPLLMDTSADRDTALAEAENHLKSKGIVQSGDVYAITCGEPMGAPGGTNMLKICRAA